MNGPISCLQMGIDMVLEWGDKKPRGLGTASIAQFNFAGTPQYNSGETPQPCDQGPLLADPRLKHFATKPAVWYAYDLRELHKCLPLWF